LETAPPKIRDEAGAIDPDPGGHRGEHEPRLLVSVDHLELDAGFAPDRAHHFGAVAALTERARRHRAVPPDPQALESVTEIGRGPHHRRDRLTGQLPLREPLPSQTNRVPSRLVADG